MLANNTHQLFGRYIQNAKITIGQCNNFDDIKIRLSDFYRALRNSEWFKYINDNEYNSLLSINKKDLPPNKSLDLNFYLTKQLLESLINTLSPSDYYIYFLDYIDLRGQRKIPIGIMKIFLNSTRTPEYPAVDSLIIQPGIQGCGCLFIEEAVNYSHLNNQKENLKLSVAANALLDVYSKMGFIPYNNLGEMVLTPKNREGCAFSQPLEKYFFIQKR
ncbi:hypothetical protein HGO23_00030 [Xenorhabdus budapestensis]|uniref:N-acetyltransferase n=1 Tax=Xenorhabdus budapestensis TaxID=290110 RepID=A0ABX7VIX6_XENBU|nr:hypothetical protein [Xenorhabdus budapestensis]QTL39886.1 hypothetical protein HGO23_00030 [Xenorhabdus budapestensis]